MRKLIFILFLLVSIPSFGTKIYVSISGDDAKDGLSEANAVLTLAYAQSLASAEDTIALKRGDIWSSTDALAVNKSGNTNGDIVWDGDLWGTGNRATITTPSSRGGTNNVALVNIVSCEYVTFENIIADGNNQICFGIIVGGHSNNTFSPGAAQDNENHITVSGCTVKDIGDGTTYLNGLTAETWNNDQWNITFEYDSVYNIASSAIDFYPGKSQDGGTPSEIRDSYIGYCYVKDYRQYGTLGVGIAVNNRVTDVIVEHNYVGDGNGSQFLIDENENMDGYYPTGIVVRYNEFVGDINSAVPVQISIGQAATAKIYSNLIKKTAIYEGGAGIWVYNTSTRTSTGQYLEFYNNTIYTGGSRAIRIESDVSNTAILENNIIYSDGTGIGLIKITTSGSTIHDHNLYYGSTSGIAYVDEGSNTYYLADMPTWEPTSQTGDPLFITDFTDLHLQSGSPAIATGTTISGLTFTDFDGNSYVDPPSMGIYESTQTPSGSTTKRIKYNGKWVKYNGHWIKH